MSGDATEKNKIIIIKVKQRREDLQLPESQPLFIYLFIYLFPTKTSSSRNYQQNMEE